MDVYPAIDLRGGRCVRLYQGDYAHETVYGDDPVAHARGFAAAGAPWIHVVDLDAARTGVPTNRAAIAAIATAVDVPVQCGGGVRDRGSAAGLFDAGVARVVVGTAALDDPGFVRELAAGHRVAVGLDVRGRDVAVRGWTEGSGRDVVDVAREFEDGGVEAVVMTQIARDGTLAGPDLEGLADLLGATSLGVIASGGVGAASDVAVLAGLESGGRRLLGAIVGRALYEGTLTIEAAIHAASSGV